MQTVTFKMFVRGKPGSKITTPELVLRALSKELRHVDCECMWCIFVDVHHRAIGKHLLFMGGSTRCQVDIACLVRRSLLSGCYGIFLVHNHPSGDEKPSIEDLGLTKNVAIALGVVGLKLIDHVIITSGRSKLRCYSMRSHLQIPDVTQGTINKFFEVQQEQP